MLLLIVGNRFVQYFIYEYKSPCFEVKRFNSLISKPVKNAFEFDNKTRYLHYQINKLCTQCKRACVEMINSLDITKKTLYMHNSIYANIQVFKFNDVKVLPGDGAFNLVRLIIPNNKKGSLKPK